MEPVLILCLLAGYLIKNAYEDGVAAWHGRPSPRIARRESHQRLARDQAALRGAPPIHTAIAGRIARRIADPPEHPKWRAFSTLANTVIVDALESATVKYVTWRADRRGEGLVDETVQTTHPCAGRCGTLLVGDYEYCTKCQPAPEPERAPDPAPAPDPQPDVADDPPREDDHARTRKPAADDGEHEVDDGPAPGERVYTSTYNVQICRVCFRTGADGAVVDGSGRCERCVKGNFGHAHYCVAQCGTPVGGPDQTCRPCQDQGWRPRPPQTFPCACGCRCRRPVTHPSAVCTPCQDRHADAAARGADHAAGYGADHDGPRANGIYRCVWPDPTRPCFEQMDGPGQLCDAHRTRVEQVSWTCAWPREVCLTDVDGPHRLCPVHVEALAAEVAPPELPGPDPDQDTADPTEGPADTTTGRTDPMTEPTPGATGTTTVDLNGETLSPRAAADFVNALISFVAGVAAELDMAANNLHAAGLSDEMVGELRELQGECDPFIAAAEAALAEFTDHWNRQQNLLAADGGAVAGTLDGTYLDGKDA